MAITDLLLERALQIGCQAFYDNTPEAKIYTLDRVLLLLKEILREGFEIGPAFHELRSRLGLSSVARPQWLVERGQTLRAPSVDWSKSQ